MDCEEKFKTIERYAETKRSNLKSHPSAGCKNGRSKLSPEKVRLIRALRKTGLSYGQIMWHVKARKSTIGKIVNYNTYKDIK